MSNEAINPVVENEVNNQVNNNQKMNNIIDFASVWGKEAVAPTETVDQQVVNDLFHAFMSIPQEVTVKFKNDKGYLKMLVSMNFREKYIRNYETYADAKLVECMIGAMRGDRIAALEIYKAEEHPIEASEVDPRINLFRQFLNSPMRCHFDADLLTNKGDRYMCATFNAYYKKHFKFCLKRTEELEDIINGFINEALKTA
jgi:hypothetical protein